MSPNGTVLARDGLSISCHFRTASEVYGRRKEERRSGLVRVWETTGTASTTRVPSTAIKNLCEIYTVQEVELGRHEGDWEEGERTNMWDTYVAEGFVQARPTSSIGRQVAKKRRNAVATATVEASPTNYVPWNEVWSREGTQEEALAVVRQEGFHHNVGNLPFASVPLVEYIDSFQAWGMGSKVRKRSSFAVH